LALVLHPYLPEELLMNMTRMASAWAIVGAVAVAGGAAQAYGGRLDDKDIKLSGCLVRGEDGGYLLTNAPGDPAWQRTPDPTVMPSTVGTTGSFATIFYWLKEQGDLKDHVGHLVEVEGDLEGDIEDGAITIDRKDKWTEIRVKSDGRDLRARVPHASIVSSPSGDKQEGKVLIRKVDVEHVKMIAASCQR
jgi:hypothetical protein